MRSVQSSTRHDAPVKTAVILAGGQGARLRSIVADLPKPMAPIGGRPFLEYLLDYWIAQGVSRFVLSVGRRHEAIRGHFGARYGRAELDYVIETTPLGTGGGFLLALGRVDPGGLVLLLNGDTYLAVGLEEMERLARAHDADWCLAAVHAAAGGRYGGVGLSVDGRVTSWGADGGGGLVNGGVYCVDTRAVTALGFEPGTTASLERDILPAALRAGQRVFGMECAGAFIDIGVPADYERAPAILKNGAQT